MKNITVILIACIVLFLPFISHSEEKDSLDLRARFGVYGNLNFNFHYADFRKLPGVPNCCPSFQSGFGTGFTAGLLFEYPLTNIYSVELRAGYTTLDGDLTKNEPTKVILDGKIQDGEFEHKLTADLGNIGVEPLFGIKLLKDLRFLAGMRLGYTIINKYAQIESITKPKGRATFYDSTGRTNSRTRNEFSGDIDSIAKFQVSILAGLSWELPLNKKGTLFFAPEIFYSYPLTPVITDYIWDINCIRAGVAIKYSPPPPLPIQFEKLEKIDTIRFESPDISEDIIVQGITRVENKEIESDNFKIFTAISERTDTLFYPKKYLLNADITAVGVEEDGKEINIPKLKIEEFFSSRLQPLLNYIFFDENSDEIPQRYIKITSEKTTDFSEYKLFYYETLPTYYQILNIIGDRLQKNPNAKLKIVGCNDGFSSEKNILELSKKRAENVRDYLKNIWNIDEKRLVVQARNLPDKASTPISEQDKFEENRRVELYSENYEIIKPVFTADTIRTSNPPIIRFKPSVNSDAGLSNWTINTYQDNKQIRTFDSSTTIPKSIDWVFGLDQTNIPRMQMPLEYILTVNDKKSNVYTTKPKSIEIEQITISKKRSERIEDKEIDKYSLILFDFDKADVSGTNRKITDFIKNRIKETSSITISGYTDRTGEDTYNKDLSQRRADATQKILNHPNSNTKGIGEDILLHNNDLPEGRFYCRTVNIVVETPIEK